MKNIKSLTILIVVFWLLQGCQNHQNNVKSPDTNQLIDLSEIDNYQFKGKMSFSDGENGGSGSVNWEKSSGLVNVRIKAPLNSKSWRLSEQTMGAELIADGKVFHADSAQKLISKELGWQVPWKQLKSWVIGQPYNNNQAQVGSIVNGFSVKENGWLIEYSRLKPPQKNLSGQLPYKMIARKGNYSIKLSIKQWMW